MLSKRISSIGMFIVSEMTENPTAKYEKFWFPASLLINCGFESAVVSVSDTNCGIAHILGPGGGGTPIWNRRGCSSEILNLTPKGDHLGVA